MIKEAENVCHQGPDAAKAARANHLAGNFPKEAFDQVEPGRGGWRKMQMKAGMALKPGNDLGMFVSGVVVADDVNIELGETSACRSCAGRPTTPDGDDARRYEQRPCPRDSRGRQTRSPFRDGSNRGFRVRI